jgi:hypothetical protein
MFATAPTGNTRPAHEETVRLAYLKAPRGRDKSDWPWPPLSESALVKRAIRFSKKVTSSPYRSASRGLSRLLGRPAAARLWP